MVGAGGAKAGGMGEGEAGLPQSKEPDAGPWDHNLSRMQMLSN